MYGTVSTLFPQANGYDLVFRPECNPDTRHRERLRVYIARGELQKWDLPKRLLNLGLAGGLERIVARAAYADVCAVVAAKGVCSAAS
jgi:hypothetical protein